MRCADSVYVSRFRLIAALILLACFLSVSNRISLTAIKSCLNKFVKQKMLNFKIKRACLREMKEPVLSASDRLITIPLSRNSELLNQMKVKTQRLENMQRFELGRTKQEAPDVTL